MDEIEIPLEDMKEFEKEYFSGKFPNQRYGQAFCNKFNIDSQALFYDEDMRRAKIIIWINFVKYPEDYGE